MKKRLLLSFATLAALVCLLATAAFAAQTAKTTANVNMRSGAGSTYSVVTIIPKGATVTVNSTANGWSNVTYNSFKGYVASQYLSTSGATGNGAGASGGSTGSTTGAGTYKTTANVNLRSGAGTTYSVVAVIPKGTTVTVLSTANGWASVNYNNYKGYVSSSYLTSSSGSSGSSGSTGTGAGTTGAGTYKTNANVNLRSGAGTTYSVVTVIPKGATVTVNSSANGWSNVTYNSYKGYVSSNYLTASSGSSGSSGTGAGTTGAGTYKTTANVNLRSGAGTTYSVVTVIPKGATVTVNSTANGWSNVTYNSYKGYVSSNYLTASSGSSGSTGTGAGTTGAGTYKTTANVNLRSGAGTTYSVVTVIPKGATVTVNSTANGWSNVTYNSYKGYVSSSYLTSSSGSSGSTSTGAGTTGAGTYKTTANVNMRSGAGTTYSVVTVIPKGATVTVSSIANGWANVTYNNYKGYVSSGYLAASSTSSGTAGGSVAGGGITSDTTPSSSTAKTTANVNLRSGAGTTYSVVTVIPKGATVTVLSSANGWSNVTYNSYKGYVSSNYLSK